MRSSAMAALLLAALAAALPTSPTFVARRAAGTDASAQLVMIAPTAASCAGAPFPSECATAAQAAPYLISAMQAQGVYSPAELAAVLSLIAFETGDFKYNLNHYPGRPGQGTRNMQMAPFNVEFASSFPELAPQVQAIVGATAPTALSDAQADAVRALVLPDRYTWQSAPWFLASKCASVRPALQKGDQAGFEAYMACVGTTATSDRLAYWTRAKAAFGLV